MIEKTGTVGISVRAKPELEFILEEENEIVGEKGKLVLKIVNKGLGEAKFVSLKVNPIGYSLLSDEEVYIGSIDSDDFETASFDVLFNSKSSFFNGIIEYRDFENKRYTKGFNIPVKVFSKEEAIKLGMIKKTNIWIYIAGGIVLILIFVYRRYQKKQRLKKSLGR